ncbi:hypothetical protein ACIRL2_29180 [Embleya sp. NPDC127516]|uniref:hypothetical protein n=1 Tax=Embleya sp. NPDC127516 TaxID=3363990 RepID=UPI0038250F7F
MTAPTRAEMRREAYLVLVLAIIGPGRLAVHLAELYGTLRDYPHWAGRDDRALRALLEDLAVPVRPQVRVGLVGGRAGIHRHDIEPLLSGVPVPDPPPSPTPPPHAPCRCPDTHRENRRLAPANG